MTLSFVLLMFNFSISEILISPEFVFSGLGFSTLYHNLTTPERRIERKAHFLPYFCCLIIGMCLVLYFTQAVIMLGNQNLFTYLCLIIGSAIIFFNAEQVYVHTVRD